MLSTSEEVCYSFHADHESSNEDAFSSLKRGDEEKEEEEEGGNMEQSSTESARGDQPKD